MMEGGCLCGALRYSIDSAPGTACHCHCLDCRGSSGAPMVTWVTVPLASFRWLAGAPKRHSARPVVVREFCGDCGTQLTFRNTEQNDGSVDVSVASLDRPDEIEPSEHLWFSRAPKWMKFDDGLPRHATRRGS